MSHVTAQSAGNQVVSAMKIAIERDVECVMYDFTPRDATMHAYLHFKNTFMVEGFYKMTSGMSRKFAEERARRNALKKAILIEQYLLCEKLYQASLKEASNGIPT